MAPTIAPIDRSHGLPPATTVVIIGAGIIGLTAALALSERDIPVVVIEKGRIAGEQSSRNLGWVRKMGRASLDVPLSLAADRLWAEMSERTSVDVGYRRSGIMYLATNDAEMAVHRQWIETVRPLQLDSRLLTPDDIDRLAPGGRKKWVGGIYTGSDGRAEPTLACSAIANAALRKGAIIVENCAARSLSLAGGRVNGVMTENGEIRCEKMLLAGGFSSRRFLGNLGIGLPVLPLIASVIRTAPLDGPTDIAVGGPDFSFRKRLDGGYTITHRGALGAPLLLDHLLIGRRYLPSLRQQLPILRISLGKEFLDDLTLSRRWKADQVSPFERVRTIDPPVNEHTNAEGLRNLQAAWPVFEKAVVEESWAGLMDITPDSLPVIGPVSKIPGLIVASGFSGHGFGTSPAAGQLAADLICETAPIVDPAPYRLDRF